MTLPRSQLARKSLAGYCLTPGIECHGADSQYRAVAVRTRPPIMIKQTSDPRLIEMGANCSEDQARAGGVPAAPVLEELY